MKRLEIIVWMSLLVGLTLATPNTITAHATNATSDSNSSHVSPPRGELRGGQERPQTLRPDGNPPDQKGGVRPDSGVDCSSAQISARNYIIKVSKLYGVNPALTTCIVEHESRFDPKRIGADDKTCRRTGQKQRSRGAWQISDCFHPEVSDDQAASLVYSTKWSVQRIKAGFVKEWSTFKLYCNAL